MSKIRVKEQNFFYKILQVERAQIPKTDQKRAKSPLFSGFFAVFVSRETDAENQTVPRETYIF